MTRILVCTALLSTLSTGVWAQTPYLDVLTAPAMIAYGNAIKDEQEKTNKNLTLIGTAQAAVMGQLTTANNLHNAVVQGLSQVSEAVRSLLAVQEIASTSQDILAESAEALQQAAGNPVLALLAEEGARNFKTRAVALAADVGRVLTPGLGNLMDAGERSLLLNHILTELKLLYAETYGINQSLYWAKLNGLWRSLNPYAGWINQDRQIMAQIIRDARNVNP